MKRAQHRQMVKRARQRQRLERFLGWRYGSLLTCAVCGVPLIEWIGWLHLCEGCARGLA